MQMDTQKPASGTMEAKFPVLYAFRKDFPMSGYEITMLLEGLEHSIEDWDKMLKKASSNGNEELMYRVLEAKLHRSELKARIERLQLELRPLPF